MSQIFCVYKNKKYSYQVLNNNVKLISEEQEMGFEPFVSLAGRISNNLFSKIVLQSELDSIYSDKYEVKYGEDYFEPMKFNKKCVKENEIILYTSSQQLADKYDFIKHEQFVFEKIVTLDDIEDLVITRNYLMNFKKRRRKN